MLYLLLPIKNGSIEKKSSTQIHFQLLMNDSESCRALIPMEYNVTHGSNTIEVQYASQISISNGKSAKQ